MAHPIGQLSRQRRYWLFIVVFGLALYVLLPQIGDFHQSFSLLAHLGWLYAWLAVSLASLTYIAAAGTYCLLAFKALSYRRTLLVQLAAMFINRLLPAGIGALGVGYLYLRRSRHSTTQAATVVAVNNILGIIGHLLLVAMALVLYPQTITTTQIHLSHRVAIQVWLIVLGVGLLGLGVLSYYRHRARLTIVDLFRQVGHYRRRPQRLVEALVISISLTLANVACLSACLVALHVNLAFAAVLVAFTLGLSVGNATPTPGGLGGIEAGLVAGLVAYHVASAAAVATVILYRLITYWLALAIGTLAFVICQKHGYLQLAENVHRTGGH